MLQNGIYVSPKISYVICYEYERSHKIFANYATRAVPHLGVLAVETVEVVMEAVLRRTLSAGRRPRNQRTAELFPVKCVAYQTFLSAKRSMPAGNVPRKSRRHDAPLPRRHRLVTLERFPKFCIPRMPNSPTCGFCHLTHTHAPTLHCALYSVFAWPITSPAQSPQPLPIYACITRPVMANDGTFIILQPMSICPSVL